MRYREIRNQTSAELCSNLEHREPISDRGLFGNTRKNLHWYSPAENVAEIAAIGSGGSPGVHSQYDPVVFKGGQYLRARHVSVTELPKCFWKMQYPLLDLFETRRISADLEGASISWSCLELRSVEFIGEMYTKHGRKAYKYKSHEEIYGRLFDSSCRGNL